MVSIVRGNKWVCQINGNWIRNRRAVVVAFAEIVKIVVVVFENIFL
mgnify:CR=1